MRILFQTIAITLVSLSTLSGFMVTIRLKQPTSFVWWGIKVFVSALAPFFAFAGVLGSLIGLVYGPLWVLLPGAYSAVVFSAYLFRVKKALHNNAGFNGAYGTDWESLISPDQKRRFLSDPVALSLPTPTPFIHQQDIPFWLIPDSNRQILCDLWRPPENAKYSGLAFIYFHGSAWGVLDKDFGTRPFFKHLVAQGHVIMDVAYRLFPETDMTGMVNDVYRAIAWIKRHAADYNFDPGKIVIGGGSAGGHLSLLAAYSNNSSLIPAELLGLDLSVQAVISEYGPTDLEAMYYHTGQHITTKKQPETKKSKPSPPPQWVQKIMGKNFHRLGMDKDSSAIGVLPVILGCQPDQCPEVYKSFSPITYIHKNCPQTLLIQGEHDIITPCEATKKLYVRLTEEGVCTAMYLIPQTDHAFDLILPSLSPVAHSAIYLIERFLAIQSNRASFNNNATQDV